MVNPSFFLRAVDPATVDLVWTDQFLSRGRQACARRTSHRAVAGQTEWLAAPAQQIEFASE